MVRARGWGGPEQQHLLEKMELMHELGYAVMAHKHLPLPEHLGLLIAKTGRKFYYQITLDCIKLMSNRMSRRINKDKIIQQQL